MVTEKRFGRWVNWPNKHRIPGASRFKEVRGRQAGVKAAGVSTRDSFDFAILNSGDATEAEELPVMSRAGWD